VDANHLGTAVEPNVVVGQVVSVSVSASSRRRFLTRAHGEHISRAARENLRIRGKKGDLSPWTSLGASA
jgi:hypothetical protein